VTRAESERQFAYAKREARMRMLLRTAAAVGIAIAMFGPAKADIKMAWLAR
jgi:hypothetical protein